MDNNVRMIKKMIRKRIAERAENFNNGYIENSDRIIQRYILMLHEFNRAKMIFCFVGTRSEINTMPLIKEAFVREKRVCVPRCIDKGIMLAYEIKGMEDLRPGKYGIAEPKEHCVIVRQNEIDFAIVPCVTCNIHGYRIGYGGGFYDRYLAGSTFATAVVCRFPLTFEDIPVETHDRKMDLVVTDHGVYRHGCVIIK